MKSESTAIAWGITIALAVATDIVATGSPSLKRWIVFVALLTPGVIPFVRARSRALRAYAAMLLLLTLLAVFFWNRLPEWMSAQPWFPQNRAGAAFALQLPKLIAAFVMMGALTGLGFKRSEYFLTGGDWVRARWLRRAGAAAVLMAVVVTLYLRLSLPTDTTARYVPLALLLAGMNAFAEEMLYRGVLLAPLLRCVSSDQAVLITAALFGIAHFYGTPSGIPGIVLTFIAGWIFAQAMVGTRGLVLPWLLHFIPDAVIYVSSIRI